VRAENLVVHLTSGNMLGYGELAKAAARCRRRSTASAEESA
jgi:hypothetical protein